MTSKREERWCKEVIRAQGREQNRHRPGESPFPVPVSCPPHLSVKCRPAVRRYNAVGWSVGTTAVLKGPHPGAGAAILNPVVLARISNPVVHAARLPQPLMPLGWWRDMDGEESMRCCVAGRARRQGADGWCCRYQVLWLLLLLVQSGHRVVSWSPGTRCPWRGDLFLLLPFATCHLVAHASPSPACACPGHSLRAVPCAAQDGPLSATPYGSMCTVDRLF
jgi:hypothetical protein